MKKIVFGIILALFFNSCLIKEADKVEKRTKRGKEIYDVWSFGMKSTLFEFINVAFNFNYWNDAPIDEKIAIEDSLFSNYKIRKEGNDSWALYQGNKKKYQIFHNNQSLSNIGTSWKLLRYAIDAQNSDLNGLGRYYFTSFFSDTTKVEITNISGREWQITINEDLSPPSYISLQVATTEQDMPSGINNPNVTYNGEGLFHFLNAYSDENTDNSSRYNFIKFRILSPLQYRKTVNSQILWSSGKIDMDAFNLLKDTINVQAQFFAPNHSYNTIQINYQGITENYP